MTVERNRIPRRSPVSFRMATPVSSRMVSKPVGESALKMTLNASTASNLDIPRETTHSRRERKNSKPGETRNNLALREEPW